MADDTKTSFTHAILSLIILAGGAWFLFGGSPERQEAKEIGKMDNQVASDAAAQYYMAKGSGSLADACSGAMMVSATYLQAKDEANYAVWKKTEIADCKAAGMPDM
jgi:hypothetical protein